MMRKCVTHFFGTFRRFSLFLSLSKSRNTQCFRTLRMVENQGVNPHRVVELCNADFVTYSNVIARCQYLHLNYFFRFMNSV